ncbi:unnamed protein product [Protopolystoma xenopodis]|uniref:Uncharacterized protein n=1 Tax=Protopolystoma xenopodis TaxID=117903 RepID=A0A448XH88_9PLAT|nr:unnamed protein product [Protopolystoma xenopodis]
MDTNGCLGTYTIPEVGAHSSLGAGGWDGRRRIDRLRPDASECHMTIGFTTIVKMSFIPKLTNENMIEWTTNMISHNMVPLEMGPRRLAKATRTPN